MYLQYSPQLQSKHGQRKQHWRGHDPDKNCTGRIADQNGPDKNSSGRITDQNGDEEIQDITEHHDDVPDEEVNVSRILSFSERVLLATHVYPNRENFYQIGFHEKACHDNNINFANFRRAIINTRTNMDIEVEIKDELEDKSTRVSMEPVLI